MALRRLPSSIRVAGSPPAAPGPWVSGTVQTNAAGWPILAAGQGAGTLMFREVQGHYPAGVYVCTFEGDGDLAFSFDVRQLVRKSANRYEFNVLPGDGGIFLNITRSNATNPVRNIHVWMPGLENAASPFHPLFVQRLRPFKVLALHGLAADQQRHPESTGRTGPNRRTSVKARTRA